MEIRKMDYKLYKELNNTSGLIVSFNAKKDAQHATQELSKQYNCITYLTENEKYYNIMIPACKDDKQLFNSTQAVELGKDICKRYAGDGFITDFGDRTSYDADGDLTAWIDGSCFEDETEFSAVEVLALQLAGISDKRILKLNRDNFDTLVKELGDKFDEYIFNARSIIRKEDKLGIGIVTFCDSYYPEMLNVLGDERPAIIHYLGDDELLDRTDSVAIIGARNADRNGNGVAYRLGTDAAKRNKVVISGLALGCDAAAHRGCLDAKGKTIAIVATGLDIVHPKEHKSLQEEILKNDGLIISEHPIGVKANPTRLVARNRLQAALAEKVVIAQCPVKSGTMHTVEFARKYRRKIYAAVYTKENEYNSGNRKLIKEQIAKPISRLWEIE